MVMVRKATLLCLLFLFLLVVTVKSSDIILSDVSVSKPSLFTTKTVLSSESEIVGSDVINCNSGYCEVVIDGKNLRGDTDLFNLSFFSDQDVEVSSISVYAEDPSYELRHNLSCVIEEVVSKINASVYDVETCEDNPYYVNVGSYKWFDLPVYVRDNIFYSDMTFFRDENFKIKYLVKNIIGKVIKYSVGIGSNIWDPLINSSGLYSSNYNFTNDVNASLTLANYTSSIIKLGSYSVAVGNANTTELGIINKTIAYWNFEHNLTFDNASTGGWGDTVTNNLLNPSGVTLAAGEGVYGAAMDNNANGNTAIVSSSQFANLGRSQDFSIAFWSKNDASAREIGVSQRITGSENSKWRFVDYGASYHDANTLYWCDGYLSWDSGDDNLAFWVITWNEATNYVRMYKDSSQVVSSNAQTCGGDLVSAIEFYADDNVGAGIIDGVMYVNKTLSQTEIDYIYTITQTRNLLAGSSATYFNASENVFYSKVFQTAINVSNFTLNVVEGTVGGLFNNTFNVSCDGTNFVSIGSENLSSGVYSGLCPVSGDKLSYVVEVGGNSSVSGNVSLINISISEYREYNFSVEAFNLFNNSAIRAFNVTINGITYNTTTGNLTTGVYSNSSGLYDVVVNADNFFSVTYSDYNVSSDLSAYLYQAVLTLNAHNLLTGSSISAFNVNMSSNYSSTASGGITYYLNGGNYTFNVTSSGFQNKSQSLDIPVGYSSSYSVGLGVYFNVTLRRETNASEPFDVNATTSTKLSIFCDNSSQEFLFSSDSVADFINCSYSYWKIDLDYNGTQYFRTLIPGGDSTTVIFYLLDITEETAVQLLLSLNDLTGSYSSGIVKIERILGDAGQKTIIEQYFDIENKAVLYLHQFASYTVSVINDDGVERSLGFLIAEDAGEKTITLPTIDFNPGTGYLETDVFINCSLDETNDLVRLVYNDTLDNTVNVSFRLFNGTNGELMYSDYSSSSVWSSSYSVAGLNHSFICVSEYYHSDAGHYLNIVPLYNFPDKEDLPGWSSEDSSKIFKWVSFLILVVIALLFSVADAYMGAVIVVVALWMLRKWGWTPVSAGVFFLAVIIAVIEWWRKSKTK